MNPRGSVAVGTCGACFGVFTLDADGRLGRHGWREVNGVRRVGEYDNVAHSEPCFGLGRLPHERSSDCAADFLRQVLDPRRAALEAALATGPDEVRAALARVELAGTLAVIDRCKEALRTWSRAPLPNPPRKGPYVHAAELDATFAACGKRLRRWANSRPLPTAARPDEVTCPRCRAAGTSPDP